MLARTGDFAFGTSQLPGVLGSQPLGHARLCTEMNCTTQTAGVLALPLTYVEFLCCRSIGRSRFQILDLACLHLFL